jgi:hypothetical protein
MESTNSPVGLANDKYGPVKTIIFKYREKCSKQDLDVTAKDQLGGSNIQIYFWDDLLLRQQQQLEHNQGKNVEPQPLEDAILGGSGGLVEQVMLTGQTGRRLVAITGCRHSEVLWRAAEVDTLPNRMQGNPSFRTYSL